MREENVDGIVNIDQKPEFRSATCEFPSLKRLSRVACFFVYANSKERIRIFGCKNKCETILCVRYVWSADKNVWQPQCNEQRGPFETSFFFFFFGPHFFCALPRHLSTDTPCNYQCPDKNTLPLFPLHSPGAQAEYFGWSFKYFIYLFMYLFCSHK